MRNNKQLIARALLTTISIGLCLYYTYWIVIMFVNYKYELTGCTCNTVIYKSHYGIIIQYITFAMYCVAIISLINFWLRNYIQKNINWKSFNIALLVTESVFMCIVIYLIPLIKRDLSDIAFSTDYLDYFVVDYILLYVPYTVFSFISYQYWKSQ